MINTTNSFLVIYDKNIKSILYNIFKYNISLSAININIANSLLITDD